MTTEALYVGTYDGGAVRTLRGHRFEASNATQEWNATFRRYVIRRTQAADTFYRNQDLARGPFPHPIRDVLEPGNRPQVTRFIDQVAFTRSGGSGIAQGTFGLFADLPPSSQLLQWPEGLIGFGARGAADGGAQNWHAIVTDNVNNTPGVILDVDLGATATDDVLRTLELRFDGVNGNVEWIVDGVVLNTTAAAATWGEMDTGNTLFSAGFTLGVQPPSGSQIEMVSDVWARGLVLLERP